MNNHQQMNELLPFYLAGTLDEKESLALKAHLDICPDCAVDLALWQDIEKAVQKEGQPVKAPQHILTQAISKISEDESQPHWSFRLWQMLRAQIPLVYKEIWPASMLVLVLGFVTTLIVEKAEFLFAVAPLVSAAGLAFIYNKAHDPAFELVLSTPISQIQILLARSGLVFGYNLALVALLSAGLSFFYSPETIIFLLKSWLAPMTFLSTLGLCLSIFMRAENAVFITYTLWISKYLPLTEEFQRLFGESTQIILSFWQLPLFLYASSLILFALTLLYIRNGFRFMRRLV